MRPRMKTLKISLPRFLLFCCLALGAVLAAFMPALADQDPTEQAQPTDEADAEAAEEQETGSLRRSDRMEFDARLVRGQKATSGAVYLFQRAPRPLPPLVVLRQSYLDRIVEPVLGKQEGDVAETEEP